jgi:hypothetical protein
MPKRGIIVKEIVIQDVGNQPRVIWDPKNDKPLPVSMREACGVLHALVPSEQVMDGPGCMKYHEVVQEKHLMDRPQVSRRSDSRNQDYQRGI